MLLTVTRLSASLGRRILATLVLVLALVPFAGVAGAQDLATAALNVTPYGFRANEGGNGAIDLGWTGGNLGNLWVEGEWVPYQLILTNIQSEYPNLTDLPDIKVSYDFTKSGARFVDLVRGIQAGQQALTDAQAWPNDAGQPYPMTTKAQIKAAQNDVGNTAPLENVWQLGGAGNFTFLDLPNLQVNRALDGSVGTPDVDRRMFIVTKDDLLAAGIPATANTIVIYYQLHESRSFVWSNALQAALASPPTGDWGGYLYDDVPFSTDSRPGSSLVPGSSGHVHLEALGGSQDVPIPIPSGLPGAVAGLKWQDDNGNAVFDGGEPTLSGWEITVSGLVDNILFTATTLTEDDGTYSFPNLTNGTWTISEAVDRDEPVQSGFNETYPNAGSAPVGAGTRTAINVAGQAAWGWSVILTDNTASQGGLNFGNRACVDVGASDLANQSVCPGDEATFTTTASGTGPFTFVWKKGVDVLSTGGNITITTNGAVSSLAISGVGASDAGSYSVTVSGQCGPDAVKNATLTVKENVATTALVDQTLCPGGTAIFTTTASGTGPFTFTWRKGVAVLSTGGDITITTNANVSTLSIANVAAEDVGSYSVTVDGACGPDAVRNANLALNAGVNATALGDQTLCPGGTATFTTTASGTGPFTFTWKKGANVLSSGGDITITTNGNVSTLSIANVEAADAGTYSVTVGGGCGDPVVRPATLTVNENVTTTVLVDQTVCEGDNASFTTTASGTGPFTFVWRKGGNVLSTGGDITITTNGNVSTLAIATVVPGDGGTYSVTVDGLCGPDAVRTGLLTVNENASVTGLESRTVCTGSDGVFTATASGTGPFTFVWKKGDVVLSTGGNITITTVGNVSTLTFSPATSADDGLYTVTVTGLCGPPVTIEGDLRVSDCAEFCSLTQGFYGNPGGSKCFEGEKLGTLALLEELITPGNPLVVGKPGRSLTVNDGSESCVIKRLPGGGSPAALPADFGNVTMTSPSCSVPSSILKNGKFNNSLLAQTITLALNLRFDVNLSSFQLCTSFTTQKAAPGIDGCLGSEDDVPDPNDLGSTYTISNTVIEALVAANLPRTPAGILELANRALAGLSTYGASASEISGAADAINKGFDECRFIVSCDNEGSSIAQRIGESTSADVDGADDATSGKLPARFELLSNQPNPFAGATTIRFSLPEKSRVTITLFNIAGQKLTTIADQDFEAGYRAVEWNAGSTETTRANGIYFYRLEGTGLDSGQRFGKTGKMIIIR